MKTTVSHWPDNIFVPGAVPASWLAYVADRQLPRDAILEQAGLSQEAASSFSAGITMEKLRRLLAAVYQYSGDDGMGFDVGWRMPPTSFGSLGSALLASPDLGNALTLLEQYWALVVRGVKLDLVIDSELGVLTFFAEDYLTGPMRHLAMDSIVFSLFRGASLLVPGVGRDAQMWLDHPAPRGAHESFELIGTLRFDMPLVQCRFPAALLKTPLPLASATGQREAIRQCEREARLLKMDQEVSARVQQTLGYQRAGYPTLETIADQLGMTTRTLRRKLHTEGNTYSSLTEKIRLRDAIKLLDEPGLEIARIGELLGYNDAANFTRAFRKQTGLTPSAYRAKHR